MSSSPEHLRIDEFLRSSLASALSFRSGCVCSVCPSVSSGQCLLGACPGHGERIESKTSPVMQALPDLARAMSAKMQVAASGPCPAPKSKDRKVDLTCHEVKVRVRNPALFGLSQIAEQDPTNSMPTHCGHTRHKNSEELNMKKRIHVHKCKPRMAGERNYTLDI